MENNEVENSHYILLVIYGFTNVESIQPFTYTDMMKFL